SGDANGMFKAKGHDEHGVGAEENKASGWCLKQAEGDKEVDGVKTMPIEPELPPKKEDDDISMYMR
ncbi:5681_t:CDS:2, partial [Cetraspora pellucida]